MRGAAAVTLALVALAPAARAQSADDWLGPDKALHFGASALFAGGGYALGALAFDGAPGRLALGAGVGLAAGVGKELLDLAGYGDPSWRDLAWDALGTGFGVLVAWLVDQAIRAPSGRPAATALGPSLTLTW